MANTITSKNASFVASIETTVRCTADCCICGNGQEDLFDTMDVEDATVDFANWLISQGWKYGVSKKLEVEGLMCPTCFKTPDKKRGD